jgi:hypothetical protein
MPIGQHSPRIAAGVNPICKAVSALLSRLAAIATLSCGLAYPVSMSVAAQKRGTFAA